VSLTRFVCSWHHLSHSEDGFAPRAAHSVVYINETDSLYVFGGFDLNHVLGDLLIYRFATSRWEDEDGKPLGKKTRSALTLLRVVKKR